MLDPTKTSYDLLKLPRDYRPPCRSLLVLWGGNPAKPIPDGWILQKARCYHGADFTELAAEQGGMAQ